MRPGATVVPTELFSMVCDVSGFVDPADSDVVCMFLMQHFQGTKWSYCQPEGYDTYDAVDVMIMSRDQQGSGGFTEAEAMKVIAEHGNAIEGRISLDTFSQLANERIIDNWWAPV